MDQATAPGEEAVSSFRRLLTRLRRWYCRTAHRDLWIHLPWGVICPKCGEVVTAWRAS